MISVVLILPAAFRAAGNAIAVALGHDEAPGNTFSSPLSPSGTGAPTHYGSHTWATPGFVDLIEAAKAGTLPPGLPAEAAPVLTALEWSHRSEAEPLAHWNEVLLAQGLKRIQPEEPPRRR